MNKFLQQILQSFCYAFYFLKEIRNLIVSREVHTVWLHFLEIFGKIGVELFILITVYFAINPRPTFKKVWQLTNTVRFYALGLFIILLVLGQLQFNTDLAIGVSNDPEYVLVHYNLCYFVYFFGLFITIS